MLIWMRTGAGASVVKYVLFGLLLLAAAGLALMDVGGFFRTQMSDTTVVKGAGIKISIQEFDRTVRRALASQQQHITPVEAYKIGAVNKILESEVQTRLFTERSQKLGLRVGDADVRKQIADMAAPIAREGMTKKQALEQVLRSQGISEGEFVSAIRQEMGNGLLRNVLQVPATLTTPMLAGDLYRYDHEKRSAKITVIGNDAITDITQPTDENLQTYYEANKQDYLIPETRTITLATLSPAMLKKKVDISDQQLHDEYDKNISSFTKPQERTVEQSVSKTEDEAKKALEGVKAGKPLKDSVGKDSYLGEQDLQKTGLLPEIAGPVFNAAVGVPVGPIHTNLGWHVLIVKKITPEVTTPFEQVKDKLKADLEQSALTDQMYQMGNTIDDAVAGGAKLEDLVKEYGMTTESIGPFRRGGTSPDGTDLFKSYGTDRQKLIQAAYDYNEGELSNLVETGDGQFHVIRIDKDTPDAYKPFETVKADVRQRWIDEQKKQVGKAKAKTILDAVNGGKSLEDVAKENHLNVRTVETVGRQEDPPAPLTPIVTAQMFTTDIGKNFSSEIKDGFLVGQVTDITLPEAPKTDSKEMTDLQELIGKTMTQDVLAQYVAHLSKGRKILVNRPLLDQTYGKPSADSDE